MRAINRKLLRDLRQMPAQILAISLVMASGVAILIMSVGTHRFLSETRDSYYDRYRFGHIFANIKRAPESVMEQLRSIPGVGTVDVRVSSEVVMDLSGVDEPIVGRLISLPQGRQPSLNHVYLRTGRMLNALHPGEVLASEGFVKANQLEIGDTIRAVINGRRQELTIVGVALSPEFIFQIRPGDILPDEKRFGIFWMNEDELEAALNMEGAFNSVSLSLMHGASEAEVIEAIDRILRPYGCTGSFGRDRQISARFLDEEIKQLRAMAFVAPTIFFSVATFLLNVVLSRLIATQREQIAALKAFGYYNYEVGWHYTKFVMVISLLGCILGALGGEFLAISMSRMYAEFYRFPVVQYTTDWPVSVAAIALTVTASVAATIRPVRKAINLPPAEAMRPAPPAKFRRTFLDKLRFVHILTTSGRMTLRELERRPLKSLMSSLGISGAVAVLILGNFGVDAIGYLIDFQFELTQRHDVSVVFIEPTASVEHELQHYPGVLSVETYRSVPVRFRSKQITHLGALTGIDQRRDLNRILDVNEQPLELPLQGMMLGEKLAEILNVSAGDQLLIDVLERGDLQIEIPVVGTYTEYAGTSAYLDRNYLHQLLQEGTCSSGAYLLVDSNHVSSLYKELKQTPRVAGVGVKNAAVDSFNKTIAENQLRMQSVNLMFACIIAFGVVYNTVRISLAERSREFATLRVIGLTRWEVSQILLFELGILTLVAIPIGYCIGYGFCIAMVKGFESELFRLPLIISPQTMAFAATITLFAAFISGLAVQRQVHQLDLIGVLKSKE